MDNGVSGAPDQALEPGDAVRAAVRNRSDRGQDAVQATLRSHNSAASSGVARSDGARSGPSS